MYRENLETVMIKNKSCHRINLQQSWVKARSSGEGNIKGERKKRDVCGRVVELAATYLILLPATYLCTLSRYLPKTKRMFFKA